MQAPVLVLARGETVGGCFAGATTRRAELPLRGSLKGYRYQAYRPVVALDPAKRGQLTRTCFGVLTPLPQAQSGDVNPGTFLQ